MLSAFYLFPVSLFVSLYFKSISYRHHRAESCSFIHTDSLCLLIGLFSSHTFNVIIDRSGFRSNILPFHSGLFDEAMAIKKDLLLPHPHCAKGKGSRKLRLIESRLFAVAYKASVIWTLLTMPTSSLPTFTMSWSHQLSFCS